MPASQIKVPAQIKGGMGLNPGGTSSQFLDGTGVPKDLSAADITAAGGAMSSELATEASTRGSADTALAAPQYVCLANSGTLPNERVLAGTSNQVIITDNGANGTVVLSLPQNIHTAASPTFAGMSLTGAVQASGTHSDPGSTITSQRRTVTGGWRYNVPTGAGYSFDTAGVQSMLFSSNSLVCPSFTISGTSNPGIGIVSCVFGDSLMVGVQHSGGSVGLASKMVSRANSTAYSICNAPTGDVLRVLLQDDSSKRAIVLVSAAGVVSFDTGSHADYVASSSPASGEVGVYLTGSPAVLTIKPGSAGARKIAASIAWAQA